MREIVTFPQIERILEILDDEAINRELIEIPLGTAETGSIELLPSGKVRVVVPAEGDFEEWVESIESSLLQTLAPLV